jgi:hypothetical protein
MKRFFVGRPILAAAALSGGSSFRVFHRRSSALIGGQPGFSLFQQFPDNRNTTEHLP